VGRPHDLVRRVLAGADNQSRCESPIGDGQGIFDIIRAIAHRPFL
jgi:hypothetical protein